MMDLLGDHADRIRAVLDFSAAQHRVIQRNLANVDTPGYRAKTLKFDAALNEAVLVEREGLNPRQDGNTVAMEVETAEMRKNQLVYRLFLQVMAHEARMVKTAIAGRGQ